jgi:predicted nucleotidyltransferase
MLKQLGITPERIIVFGSQAQGRANEYSDIDVVVISEDFAKLNLRERLEILGIAAARIMESVQALGYTAEEFEAQGKGSFIGDEVKGTGVEI